MRLVGRAPGRGRLSSRDNWYLRSVRNGVALGSITLVTVFGTLIAQVWTGDGDDITIERFRFSIAAGIIVAHICLLCILVFSTFNPSASVFRAFSWVAGVVLSFYFATSSIDNRLEYLAAAASRR
jgi:hypothetical protein